MSTAVASIVTSSDSGSTIDSEREQQVCSLDVAQKDILTETWKEIDDEEKKQSVGIMLFNRLVYHTLCFKMFIIIVFAAS